MINIITIDPSLISTALTINGKLFSIVAASISLTKKQALNGWFERASEFCDITTIDTSYNNEKNYAQLEINKLETFQRTANLIRKLIDTNCDSGYSTIILIEGYSFSSNAGPLIDLVTFGTLVRRNLFTRSNTELVVLSPSTVKKMAAKLTYDPIYKGKKVIKVEYRNNEGVAGGSFKKHDIYKALTENDSIQTDWVNFLRDQQEVVFGLKKVPKPLEDINDSVVMYHSASQVCDTGNEFSTIIDQLRE